jgi:hypothetical protein
MASYSGTVVHATAAALLIEIDGSKYWLPFSQIEVDNMADLQPGEEIDIEIPDWLARAKGLD